MKPGCEKASDADWLLAGRREDALKTLLPDTSPTAVAQVAADLGLSAAMVYRLLAAYRRDPSTRSLLPNRGGRARGARLLATDVETVIQASIFGYYLKKQRPRIADLHRHVILECRKTKISPPSYKAIRAGSNLLTRHLPFAKEKEPAPRATSLRP